MYMIKSVIFPVQKWKYEFIVCYNCSKLLHVIPLLFLTKKGELNPIFPFTFNIYRFPFNQWQTNAALEFVVR